MTALPPTAAATPATPATPLTAAQPLAPVSFASGFVTPFLALVRKDLILFLSDRRALLVSLLLPIVIGTFFGYLFGDTKPKAAGRIEMILVRQDSGAVAAAIAAGLRADPGVKLVELDLAQAREQVRQGTQKVAIIMPPGFTAQASAALMDGGPKPAITLLYDPTQQAALAMAKGLLTQYTMQYVIADAMKGEGGPDGASLSTPFSTSDEAVKSGAALAGYNAYAHSFAGMGVQFILFWGIDIGIGVLLAQRSGVWQRLQAAPVTLATILLGRAASAALIAFALLCVMFAFAVLVLGVRIANLAGFIGVALCFALLTASFGLFIAAFGKTPDAARGIALFATLIMVMLGGAWVPSFMFPEWVQQASMLVPTRWAIDGLDAMTWRGLGMAAAWQSMAAQLGFALVFGVLAMWKFGRR